MEGVSCHVGLFSCEQQGVICPMILFLSQQGGCELFMGLFSSEQEGAICHVIHLIRAGGV